MHKMLPAIRLSTLRTAEHNAELLLSLLRDLSTSSATASIGKFGHPLDVYLIVHDLRRETLLSHAQALYTATLKFNLEAFVDVIPMKPLTTESSPELLDASIEGPIHAKAALPSSDSLFSAGDLLPERGFNNVFRYVAVGGTFDHLHSGHKMLLTTALMHTTAKLRVGVTGSELLKNKKFADQLQANEERTAAARAFLEKLRKDVCLEVETIFEPSGGTNTIPDVEALVVSPETESAVGVINETRSKNGLSPLVGIPIQYVEADGENRVSSTRLRELAKNPKQK